MIPPTRNVGHRLIDDLLAMRASVRALVRSPDSARIGADERTGAAIIQAHRDIEQHIERSRLAAVGAGAAR